MDQSFPRKEKLKSKKRIEQVFTEGASVSKYPLKLVYLPCEFQEDTAVQVAVSVPKRRFKRAVDRNRVKRLMRESWRLQKATWLPEMKQPHGLLFIYIGRELPTLKQLQKAMDKTMHKFLEKQGS